MDEAANDQAGSTRPFSPIRQPMAAGGQSPAHRHPRGFGISRRRPRAEDQARGALSVSRLFDAGQAQGRLRRRDRGQRGSRRKSIAASSPSRARATAGWRSAATARRSNGRSTWGASTRTARSIIWRMRSTTSSPMRSAAPSPPPTRRRRSSRPSRGSTRSAPISTSKSRRFGEHPEIFPAADAEALAAKSRAALSTHRAAVARARPARAGSPHPRRSSSRQYRADRRRAGAVRRHRIQRHHRLRRRALRSRFSADGPARARAAASGQYRAQPLPCRDAQDRRPRCVGGAAVLSVDARRDPRQGHGGAAGAR